MAELPEGYHFANGPELLAIKHFPATRKALYDLASLFITGPLRKEHRRPEVQAAVAAITSIALDMPKEPMSETQAQTPEAIRSLDRPATQMEPRGKQRSP